MTQMTPRPAAGPTLTRRGFVAGSTGLVFAISCAGLPRPLEAADGKSARPFTAWVRIGTDDVITILNPAAEMGQGSGTALPVIVAEELDADWSKVRVEFAPLDSSLYGNPRMFGGQMITVGSRAVQGYYEHLRIAGAQARRVLLDNAARHWNVDVASLTTEPSVVVHRASGRRLSYGEIAAFARVPDTAPSIGASDLKKPGQFRLIGKFVPRDDIPAKIDGSAMYSIDVDLPGMAYAMMARSPVNGSRPVGSNTSKIKSLPGVLDVITMPYGVAIVGESVESVRAARPELEVQWSGAPAAKFDSESAFEAYAAAARSPGARSLSNDGDVARALKGAARTVTAEYASDHVYHAQMEPLNAVASVNAAGDGAEIWGGSQGPELAIGMAARLLGTSPDRITYHRHYLGGAFGRRSMPENIVEAVAASKAVRRPVKMIWSREDDIQYGAFRPMSFHRMEAGLDSGGNLTAWKHRVVADGGRFGMLATSGIRIPYYSVPNRRIDWTAQDDGVRVQFWRAVAHGFTKFAIESFVDDIAHAAGVDPAQYRRRLLRNAPRYLRVLDEAASMAGWGTPRPAGRALGIALADRSDSIIAGVAEVSLDRASGKIRVHRFWAACDAGVIVQPDNALAQMEGGIVYGLSSVLTERITFAGGEVQQSNFHDYEIMRIADAPEDIQVKFIPSTEPPTGVGEAGGPVTAGAVGNAVFALTGKRLHHLPFTPERVKAALG